MLKGHILHQGDKTNSAYEIKKRGGKEYMFFEWKSGDYIFRGQKPAYYVLEKEDKKLVGPAMSEDLDYYNGKFYTNFESASNKYVYGKFFLESNKIVALDFSKIVK